MGLISDSCFSNYFFFQVETLENQNKILQERNIKLESANKNLEKEKNMISKYNITLEKLCLVYEAHIVDAKVSLLSPFFLLSLS